MNVATGRVTASKVILEGEPLSEGSVVTVLAQEDDETFDVTGGDQEQRAGVNRPGILRAAMTQLAASSRQASDLILLDADPTIDIPHVTAIRTVVCNALLFEPAELDRLLVSVERADNPTGASRN